MLIGGVGDGGTHIVDQEERHYTGPMINFAELLRIPASAKGKKSLEPR